MSGDRTERLLNLVLCLLSAHQPVPRETIRRIVAGYDPGASDAAFERMFERDKDDLRTLGIPIVTVSTSDGEVLGYRIPEEDYRLAQVHVTAQQWALLGVAARAWAQANLASAAQSGVRKIESMFAGSGDDTPEIARVVTWQQGPRAGSEALPRIWQAIREHRRIRFDYQGRRDERPRTRVMEPWSIVGRDGGWYLIGLDVEIEHSQDGTRVFRTSRMIGTVEFASDPGSFTVPDHDPDELITPEPTDWTEAWVAIEPGYGAGVRSRALTDAPGMPDGVGSSAPQDDGQLDAGADVMALRTTDRHALISDLCALGPHVRVLAPADLAEEVAARWTRIAALHGQPDDSDAGEVV